MDRVRSERLERIGKGAAEAAAGAVCIRNGARKRGSNVEKTDNIR